MFRSPPVPWPKVVLVRLRDVLDTGHLFDRTRWHTICNRKQPDQHPGYDDAHQRSICRLSSASMRKKSRQKSLQLHRPRNRYVVFVHAWQATLQGQLGTGNSISSVAGCSARVQRP